MTALLSSRATHQRERILDWLRERPLTTAEARQFLDVFHPAARVQELRERGENIVTFRTEVETGRGRHKQVARYVLLSGSQTADIKKPATSANQSRASEIPNRKTTSTNSTPTKD